MPILAEALSSGDKTVRQRAAQVLGEIPAAGALAIQSLVQALGDEEETVRLTVLNTLNNLGTAAAPAASVLVEILVGSQDIIERGLAALALGSIGPTAGEAIPQLLKCLQEPGDSAARIYFRLKVADALWRISGVIRSPFGNCEQSGEKSRVVAAVARSGITGRTWKCWKCGHSSTSPIGGRRTPICASFGSGVAEEDRGRSVTPNPLGKDRQRARFAALQFDLLPDCHEHADWLNNRIQADQYNEADRR